MACARSAPRRSRCCTSRSPPTSCARRSWQRWHSSWPRERACCAAHERPAARASLRPSVVRLESPLTRELLRLLDGTRDRAALPAALAARMANDTALIPPGEPARPASWWREHLETRIDEGLAQVVRLALLVA
ncbi:MAG TPA: hypothetical protein VIR05_00280 [Luteimonas sp.]